MFAIGELEPLGDDWGGQRVCWSDEGAVRWNLATATVTAMDLATETCSLVLGAKAELLQKLQAQWKLHQIETDGKSWKRMEEEIPRTSKIAQPCSALIIFSMGCGATVRAVHRLQRIMDPARARGQRISIRRGSKQTAPPTGSPGLEMLQVSTGTTA